MGVVGEPDVVLGDEELEADPTEEGEGVGEAASKPARAVPEPEEANNLQKSILWKVNMSPIYFCE
jgi:hypothetical protein